MDKAFVRIIPINTLTKALPPIVADDRKISR